MALIGNLLIGFESITCPTCGLPFGLPARTLELWQRDETTFHCPNGHEMYRPSLKTHDKMEFLQSEVQRLKEENINMRQQLEQAEASTAAAEVSPQKVEAGASAAPAPQPPTPTHEKRIRRQQEKVECLACHRKLARKFISLHLKAYHANMSPEEQKKIIC